MTVHEKPVGATVEWYTPPDLFAVLNIRFDLDPAAGRNGQVVARRSSVPTDRQYTAVLDGLTRDWRNWRVWLNPPYGPAGVAFIDKMIAHDNGLMLLPARTETDAFQRAAHAADEVCFLRERLHFIREDGYQARASFGSVLLAYGWECADILRNTNLGVTGSLRDGAGTGAKRRPIRRTAA